jgi:hypothetical protein
MSRLNLNTDIVSSMHGDTARFDNQVYGWSLTLRVQRGAMYRSLYAIYKLPVRM